MTSLFCVCIGTLLEFDTRATNMSAKGNSAVDARQELAELVKRKAEIAVSLRMVVLEALAGECARPKGMGVVVIKCH